MSEAERRIREQDIRDFEWACSLNPNPFRTSRHLRNIASDHAPQSYSSGSVFMTLDELRERDKKIADRRRGIEPLVG